MIPSERDNIILSRVNDHGIATVRELAQACDVTEMTIRRDLARLDAMGMLRRTYGGAVKLSEGDAEISGALAEHEDLAPDALILAPVQNNTAHTIRERAIRNQIPFIAESSPQSGAVYLGPDNYQAGYELGVWTGAYFREHVGGEAHILCISQYGLANTKARTDGFTAGVRDVLGDEAHILTVDGRGIYSEVYRIATDVLRLHPHTNVIFAINDDSILAGIQAYRGLRYDVENLIAVNVGGEGSTLFNALQQPGSPLKACMALFPEIVGYVGVELVARLWSGEQLGDEVITPRALLTADTLTAYYYNDENAWIFDTDHLAALVDPVWLEPRAAVPQHQLSFVVHYPTHEWYQNLARAMKRRADALGIVFSAVDVNENVKAEIRDLRCLIGKAAADYVNDGETIILDTGTATSDMACYLAARQNLTVVTNSIDVCKLLQPDSNIDLVLTGGSLDRDAQALVGRGARLLLKQMHADKVFLVAGGLSSAFGISSITEAEADIRRTMIQAAREVVVLADHTVIDTDAKFHVDGIDRIDTLITDAGIRASQSLEFSQQGIKIIIAGQPTHS
ncbi:MAG TPA: substrate-binding domain-containing protein [Aggregatilinea sp.]|uniref:substrate-binding domain-containing protein n=1 Tax=Aggregatilinea sp. TaxID=2806333 RepID=UPI002B53B76F|nr:substrate-binding domain-containing protein [Aggregatilinea sp.]HML21388.1 substrate-binding domain-containing protein [Aggregatilinea sp.]